MASPLRDAGAVDAVAAGISCMAFVGCGTLSAAVAGLVAFAVFGVVMHPFILVAIAALCAAASLFFVPLEWRE